VTAGFRSPSPITLSFNLALLLCPDRLSSIIAKVASIESTFWSLAEGPWAGANGMNFRQRWVAALRSASSVREVAHALLQLEAALRPLAFVPAWRAEQLAAAAPTAPAGALAAGGSRSQPPSRTVSRVPSAADLEGLSAAAQAGSEVSASLTAAGRGGVAVELDGMTPAAAARLADPYDVRYEQAVMKGWEVNRRHFVAREHGVNRLPLPLARKVSRRSG
jgi:hypothetical protein